MIPGSGQESKARNKLKKTQNRYFPDFVWWLLAQRFVWFLYQRPDQKHTTGKLALHFWRLSLSNSYTLAKAMCARATSRQAGSEVRGEARERGNLQLTTSKPPVAQGAGWILFLFWPVHKPQALFL